MVNNKALVFKKVPQGLPKVGEHIAVEEWPVDVDNLEDGSIAVQILYTSVDPYMRGRMRDANTKSYAPAFELNKPINTASIAKVIKSANENFKEGQIISVGTPLGNYAVIPKDGLARASVIDNSHKIELGNYLGALGMPGLTAYSSFYAIGQPKKGETIFVTAASGAVGQLVIQLAKHEGLKVIGSVGDDEKAEFITKELGADAAFNYKKEKPADALKRLAPDGIDIYYENVGGENFEAALDAANNFARFVVCGAISQYNLPKEQMYPIRNISMNVIAKRLTIRGFIVGDADMGPKYFQEHRENVSKWLAEGSFKARLEVFDGIDQAGEALLALFKGTNKGKVVIKTA